MNLVWEIVARAYHLGIGEMVLGTAPAAIVTVLGSCVAVTMYEPSRRLGAICHAALPQWGAAPKCHLQCDQSGKYVECAVKVMLKQFDRRQIFPKDIQVKIFGGANMFLQSEEIDCVYPVGSMNIESALSVIQDAGLKIIANDTGGNTKKKIIFDLATGKVFVERHLK